MSIKFKFLEAGSGDSILIFIDKNIMLIDGGDNFETIYHHIEDIRKTCKNIDLMILSHQDDDHILGLLNMLSDKNYRKLVCCIWFNSCNEDNIFYFNLQKQTSTRNAIKFHEFVLNNQKENQYFSYRDCICVEDENINPELEYTTIKILSPTQEKLIDYQKRCLTEKDNTKTPRQTSRKIRNYALSIEELYTLSQNAVKDKSVTNGASIAFILTYKNKYNFLLLGDAHIDIIINSLHKLGYSDKNKLKTEFVKLSHHGSIKNINQDFLNIIDTNCYIILTNGVKHNHPDPETISLIVMNQNRNRHEKLVLKFNYQSTIKELSKFSAFNAENMRKYNFSFEYASLTNFCFD